MLSESNMGLAAYDRIVLTFLQGCYHALVVIEGRLELYTGTVLSQEL